MALLFASVIFFCARFSARRCIKICKNQKYYLTYLHNSKIICNFAPKIYRWHQQRKKVTT